MSQFFPHSSIIETENLIFSGARQIFISLMNIKSGISLVAKQLVKIQLLVFIR